MAVMASEAPLKEMAFNEKAHSAPQSEKLALPADVNGSNHYDALFSESLGQNGTHSKARDAQDSDTILSDTIALNQAAVKANAVSIASASGGISPNASILPEPLSVPSVLTNDLPVTTTVPPPVEQPTSDARSDLPAQESSHIANLEGSANLGSGVDDVPFASHSAPEDMGTSREPEVMEIVQEELAIDEHSLAVAEEGTPRVQEDAMDMTEDVTAPVPIKPIVPSDPVNETIPLEEAAPVTQSRLSGLESPKNDISIFGEPAPGQVRQRENDDDDVPSAKRAKTQSADENGASMAKVEASSPDPGVSISLAQADAPSLAADAAANPVGPIVSEPSATPQSWDSQALTPIQQKYIVEQVRKAKKVKFGRWFLKPVDPVALNIPTYFDYVKHPMDLGTLEERVRRHEYSTADAFMADFNLIIDNCLAFNGPAHTVSQEASNLRAYFNKNMSLMPTGESAKPVAPPQTKSKKPTIAASKKAEPRPERKVAAVARSPVEPKTNVGYVKADGMPIIRRISTHDDRPKREIVPPKNRDLPHQGARPKKKKHQVELKFCESVCNEFFKKKYTTFTYPFITPVDPVALNIPTYHKIIKKPMDFGTIHSNLKNAQYGSAKDFYNDAKLVFDNCFKFNNASENVYKMGEMGQELFNKLWEGKDQYVADNTPTSEPASDAEDEDEDDEEEESEESEQHRRMLEIQKQIAALSAEAMTLTGLAAPKRASPKTAGKKNAKTAKSNSSKAKRANNGAVGLSTAKVPKAKKPGKVRKLTLTQKREVSEGIGNLDEGQMRKAVQIIRNGVPSLRDVHDDELELDIDEIPDAVVLELYDFVRKLRTRAPAEEPEDDEYTEPEITHKPASMNRKKNKPMKAVEQEERIQQLAAQLNLFKGNSGSEQSPDNHQDESSDDNDSESSEAE